MDLTSIKALIDAMAASDLAEMAFSENGWSLQLARRDGRLAPVVAPPGPMLQRAPSGIPPRAQTSAPHAELQAPLSGVVHLRPSPGEPPFVTAGQAVEPGQTLCIIEAMKMFNPVQAERGGTVAEILVMTGSEVEAGQTLMRIV